MLGILSLASKFIGRWCQIKVSQTMEMFSCCRFVLHHPLRNGFARLTAYPVRKETLSGTVWFPLQTESQNRKNAGSKWYLSVTKRASIYRNLWSQKWSLGPTPHCDIRAATGRLNMEMVTWPGAPLLDLQSGSTCLFDFLWGGWLNHKQILLFGSIEIGFASCGSHSLSWAKVISQIQYLNGTLLVIFLFILAGVIVKCHESQKVSLGPLVQSSADAANLQTTCSSMVCKRKQPHGCCECYDRHN